MNLILFEGLNVLACSCSPELADGLAVSVAESRHIRFYDAELGALLVTGEKSAVQFSYDWRFGGIANREIGFGSVRSRARAPSRR